MSDIAGERYESQGLVDIYRLDDPKAAARVFGSLSLIHDTAYLATFEQGLDLSKRATSIFLVKNGRKLGDPANEPQEMRRENEPPLTIWADLNCVAIAGIDRRRRLAKPKGKLPGIWTSMDSQVFPFTGDKQPRTIRAAWRGIRGDKRDEISGAKRSTVENLDRATEAFDDAVDFELKRFSSL